MTIVAGINQDLKCTLTMEDDGVGVISPGSLQGQITERWYGGSGNLKAQLTRGMEQAGVTGEDKELGDHHQNTGAAWTPDSMGRHGHMEHGNGEVRHGCSPTGTVDAWTVGRNPKVSQPE